MKIRIPVLLFVVAFVFTACKSQSQNIAKSAVTEENVTATEDSVERTMNFLASDELQGRDSGSEGIEKAANYIEEVFKRSGVFPFFGSYKDSLSNLKNAYNVVGVVEGNDPKLKNEYIVLGAHYDHIGRIEEEGGDDIANGANDNASGTTAVLELAKYFGTVKTNKRTLIFALFSAEEKGLLGSKHLAKKLHDEGLNLYVMINFEMIGVPMNRTYSAYITGYENSNMASVMNTYAKKELVGFLPKAKEYNLFKRSDNYPFYEEFNVPCQTLSTFDFTNYAYYHKVDDEVSEMDFAHIARFINDMIPVVEGVSGSASKKIKFNEQR